MLTTLAFYCPVSHRIPLVSSHLASTCTIERDDGPQNCRPQTVAQQEEKTFHAIAILSLSVEESLNLALEMLNEIYPQKEQCVKSVNFVLLYIQYVYLYMLMLWLLIHVWLLGVLPHLYFLEIMKILNVTRSNIILRL